MEGRDIRWVEIRDGPEPRIGEAPTRHSAMISDGTKAPTPRGSFLAACPNF